MGSASGSLSTKDGGPNVPLVVDASVALSWCFRDEESDYAAGILRRLARDTAVVPGIWPLEVANGLLVAERRKRLTAAGIMQVRGLLADLPIVVDTTMPAEAFGSVIDVARAYELSAYDAAYLALAMREGLPLATLDGRLTDAARAAGLALA